MSEYGMIDQEMPAPASAGGGPLVAHRVQYGIVFKPWNSPSFSMSSHEARFFAIQLLVLCEHADKRFTIDQLNEQIAKDRKVNP